MAPPDGVVLSSSPQALGHLTLPLQVPSSQLQNKQHQPPPHRALQPNQQQQERHQRCGGNTDRRHHANNNRVDVNANRRKIRRQGSLKTIQEENMPLMTSTSALDDNSTRARPLHASTPRATPSKLSMQQQRRASSSQQQHQRQQQQQQQEQNKSAIVVPPKTTSDGDNSPHGIGIPQPPPLPPAINTDLTSHTISTFIPDDAMPLLFPTVSSQDENNRYHSDQQRQQQPQQTYRVDNDFGSPPPSPFSGSSSLYDEASRLGYDNLVRVLNFHPKYLEIFLQSHLHLLTGDGPLPFTHRAYIGIMAVSRLRCSHLAQTLTRDFLQLGGDSNWLEGVHRAPKKIRALSTVNKILAHRPWLIRKDHIRELTKNFEQAWSASELVHALTLLTHFHALSSFVFACGLQRDDDAAAVAAASSSSGASTPPSSPGSPAGCAGGYGGNGSPMESGWMMDSVVERMQRRFNNQREELTQEECVKRFYTVGSQTAELPAFRQSAAAFKDSTKASPNPSSSSKNQMTTTMMTELPSEEEKEDIFLRFIEDPGFTYVDFAKSVNGLSSTNSTPSNCPSTSELLLEDEHLLCVQDYSWQDHGFSILNRFYDAAGSNLLDDKFRIAENLTYRTMATHSGVDTSVFRRAIWNYIDVIFGIRHDDYDYKEINELMPQNMKKFIKAAVCSPDKLVKKDYRDFMRELKHSEKVHVNIIMLEARFQGEMLYALRAVTQHLV